MKEERSGLRDRATAGQLSAAAFTGLLTPAAAVAGGDWQGGLLAVPVVLLAACCWERLGDWTGSWKGTGGRALSAVYLFWTVLTAGVVLAGAGARMTAPDGRDAGWVIVLIWIPVLLLARKGTAVCARAAQIFCRGMTAVLALVLILGGRELRWERLLRESGALAPSFLSAVGVGCCGVAALLAWDGREEGGTGRRMAWSGALAGATALMRAVSVGVLGRELAAGQERPFFLMTVGAGRTARVEGLAEAAFLLADVTLAALMLQCGKRLRDGAGLPRKGRAPWVIPAAALAFALWLNGRGTAERWLRETVPATGLILGGAVPGLALLGRRWRCAALHRKSGKGPGGEEKKKR